ncbi:hypothetical protein ACFFP0_31625 [Rhizobium puerariae]|uniref:KTSC domain-containing protein n=1 Tax=Rhizobium puerariae TaxID=1585791 RepID=A0ABV6AS23_9HYPH
MDIPILEIGYVGAEGRVGYHFVAWTSPEWRCILERFRTAAEATEYTASFYSALGYPQLYRGVP